MNTESAFGHPGIEPRWTSGAKSGVGTALTATSRVWFTISHGILNEVYYPRIDTACTRDLGLIVTDGREFFSEEKRHAHSAIASAEDGVPAYRVVNTCRQGRYRLEKEILADPRRDVVLQRTRFVPLQGTLADYQVFALLAPHLGNRGWGNTAFVGGFKGMAMLMAERPGYALALACSVPWLKCSAGFVGASDGWQDLSQHKRMTWDFARAEDGNVALTGQVDLLAAHGEFLLALGFGPNATEAGHHALASLQQGFEPARAEYVEQWRRWQDAVLPLDQPRCEEGRNFYRIGAAVLRSHDAIQFPGGIIASLSVPWGSEKSDKDLGGYHLVWPRDLAEAGGGLLAAGAREDARRVLCYFQATQEADGHWAQNMWLDGTPYWNGIQLDETALPILLLDLARREGALDAAGGSRFWPMARKAAAFLVRNGPVTGQDRWEEDAGYSPFTLAATIAALLAAADLAESNGEPGAAAYLRETADAWNDSVERWTYVTDTDLARRCGVPGYYVRIAPPEMAEAASPAAGFVPIKNRPPDHACRRAGQIVSPDALALVRFGLRAADDPRIVNTVKVIDALLRVETPAGLAWRRYNEDGYGEHEDGAPFDGTGIGRAWPLLAGERAHYELAAGRRAEAERLLRALENFGNDGGLFPEQVWDAPDIPGRELFFGRPSGSATPLVWAHAEHIKLCRSLRDGRVFDLPPQPAERYVLHQRAAAHSPWRFNQRIRRMSSGKILRIEAPAPAVIRWTRNDWSTHDEMETQDSALGIHYADLPSAELPAGTRIAFTLRWLTPDQWEGHDYEVAIE
ncbi:MAG: glucan 1,4-alpha-glucosidase [Verrucomicrobiales bacterium]|nr:glucan 1,4-alpha-glucosidase [Verrucomicrobiales bacterium]